MPCPQLDTTKNFGLSKRPQKDIYGDLQLQTQSMPYFEDNCNPLILAPSCCRWDKASKQDGCIKFAMKPK
jgi:hypothetical protein